MNKTLRRAATTTLTLSTTAAAVLVSAMPAHADVDFDPTPELPGDLQGKLNSLLGMGMGLAIFACIAGLIICAALMAIASRRGSLEDHMGRLGAVMAACVLIGSASSIVFWMM
ncbi:TrbC/VirB2 family protein [Nocardioides lijunqiniae]|uniref:TrbC/VirB2 family protein n=1 Tax=Nocardioides lijunqiniae TaxID=2760832 RepID=UPI001878B5B6|nr:TrbC/VirB2 family protein [Nocardioides lijunqiniae]